MTAYSVSTYRRMPAKANRKLAARLLLLTLIVIIATSIFALMKVDAEGAQPVSVAVHTTAVQKVEVHSGDTLWGLANRHVPEGGNVRSYMEKLVKKNHLTTTKLSVGQLLELP